LSCYVPCGAQTRISHSDSTTSQEALMTQLIGVSGSLRQGSFNAALLRAAVATLKEAIAAADGLLLVTPEYNNSIPGVFKNAIDWLSRPPADIKRVFGGRPFAVIGASPGAFGTTLSQAAWLPVLRTLGTQPWFGARLMVSRAATVFDESGALKDAAIEEQLRQFLAGYVAFLRRD